MICYIIYYVHRIDQKVSLYIKCGAGVGVKREFVPASLPEYSPSWRLVTPK